MLIENILGRKEEAAYASLPEDTVLLELEEAAKRILRKESAAGRDVAIRLAFGGLEDGSVLAVEEGTAIVVRLRPAHVICAEPATPVEAVRFAYEVGNRHAPLYQQGSAFLVPWNALLLSALQGAGVTCREADIVISPREKIQLMTKGHGHAHSHSHREGGHDHGVHGENGEYGIHTHGHHAPGGHAHG